MSEEADDRKGILPGGEAGLAFAETLAFLATAANGTLHEPKLYGTLRLMQALDRVAGAMEAAGLTDEALLVKAREIGARVTTLGFDQAAWEDFTNDAVQFFVERLHDTHPVSRDT
ncbi:MAG: DUF6092 family protein [Thermoleophilia bacterium]|nr:DUF6092 family protein [Thermoleophilia bacterium]